MPYCLPSIYSVLYQKCQSDTQDFTAALPEITKIMNKILQLTRPQIPHSGSKSDLFSNPTCLKGNKQHGHLCQVKLSNTSAFGLTLHQRHSLCQRPLKQSLKVSLHLDLSPSPSFKATDRWARTPAMAVGLLDACFHSQTGISVTVLNFIRHLNIFSFYHCPY